MFETGVLCAAGPGAAATGGSVNRPSPTDATPDALALHFQAGDEAALADLYQSVLPVLRATVWRTARRGLPPTLQVGDLQQQSWLILAELPRRWEPRAGVPFAAYLAVTFPWAL